MDLPIQDVRDCDATEDESLAPVVDTLELQAAVNVEPVQNNPMPGLPFATLHATDALLIVKNLQYSAYGGRKCDIHVLGVVHVTSRPLSTVALEFCTYMYPCLVAFVVCLPFRRVTDHSQLKNGSLFVIFHFVKKKIFFLIN